MNAYYYLISSLPTLSFKDGETVPFTRESFLEAIKGFVPERDYKAIENIFDGKSVKRGFIKEYNRLSSSIERALMYYRAKRLSIDDEKYADISGIDSDILSMAEKAVSNENPYESELEVFGIYWKALDNLQLNHFGDFLSLAVYALKLKLLFRKTSFNKQKGEEEAERLFASYNVLEELLNEQ